MFALITNRIFLASITGWFTAQLIKFLIKFSKTKTSDIRQFVKAGGMPSAHSATVSALLTSLYLIQGITTLFVVALVFSLIVFRDAMIREKKTRHTLKEVLAGIILGVLIGFFVALL